MVRRGLGVEEASAWAVGGLKEKSFGVKESFGFWEGFRV